MGKNSKNRGGKTTNNARKAARQAKFGKVAKKDAPEKKKKEMEKEYNLNDDLNDDDEVEEDSEEENWGGNAKERGDFWAKYDAEQAAQEEDVAPVKVDKKRKRKEMDDADLDAMLAPKKKMTIVVEEDEDEDEDEVEDDDEDEADLDDMLGSDSDAEVEEDDEDNGEEEAGKFQKWQKKMSPKLQAALAPPSPTVEDDDQEEEEEEEEEEGGEEEQEDSEEGPGEDDFDGSEESDEEDTYMKLADADKQADIPADLIDVDFEFHDPQESDFHSIKNLVVKYLDDREFDASGLADFVCEQARVGTTVRVTDYDETYAFITVVNLQLHKDKTWVKQIKKALINECPSDQKKNEMELLLEKGHKGKPTGLIISGRVINFPPQLLPHLNRGLFDEIKWAREDEPTQAQKDSFKFGKYIVLPRVYEQPDAKMGGASSGKKKKKKRELGESELMYTQLDEEVYARHADLTYNFKTPVPLTENQKIAAYGMAQFRRVVVFDASKAEPIAEKLRALIEQE